MIVRQSNLVALLRVSFVVVRLDYMSSSSASQFNTKDHLRVVQMRLQFWYSVNDNVKQNWLFLSLKLFNLATRSL